MTVTIALPSLASAAVWLAIILATNAVTWQVSRIWNDRSWEADVRKRAAWCFRAPHLHAGDPLQVPSRPTTDIALYRVRPYGDRDEETALAA